MAQAHAPVNGGAAGYQRYQHDQIIAGLKYLGVHDISMLVGNKLEVGEQEWTPAARKNMETGALYLP